MGQTLARALVPIPRRLRSLLSPQLEQLGAAPVATRIGFAARLDGPRAKGWWWACAVGDDCLVSTVRIRIDRTFVLVEEPEVVCRVIARMARCDTCPMREDGRADGAFTSLADPTMDEDVLGFRTGAGHHECPLAAGSVHEACRIHMAGSFLDGLGIPGGSAARIRDALDAGVELNQALGLRSVLRSISSADADRPLAELHYRAKVMDALFELAGFVEGNAPQDGEGGIAGWVCSLLRGSLANPPTIGELAASLYLSRTTLCARFRCETGMSIGDALAHLRVEEAKSLLSRTGRTLGDVAHAVGYRHQSSFTTAFRQATGVTPQRWRDGMR